jgi:hypothetical protein
MITFLATYGTLIAVLVIGWRIVTWLADRETALEQAILDELKIATFDTVRLAAIIAYRQGRRWPISQRRIRRAVRLLVRRGKVTTAEYGSAPGYAGRTFVTLETSGMKR